jgi:hypothetical protein
MIHCIAFALFPVASSASNQKLGQTNLLISQPSKQRNFSLNQGLGVCPTSSHGLEVYLKYFGQGLRAQRSAVHTQTVKNPKSQLLVNCPFNQWLDDWNWFVRVHSCPNSHHTSCQTPSWKNLKPDHEFPKMETGPVTETYQKWKVLILKLTSWYKPQMNFCPTWKLKILFSHFQKVLELSIPMCGWQVMIESISENLELQRAISLKPFGQFWWGFFLQVTFDPLFPKI